MSDSTKHDDSDENQPKQTPLNLNDLASNPMRVGMARLGKDKRPKSAQPKKHWWTRRKK
ncbi:hypothetical protein HC026_04445 [Lactobacillus sp. LC28-10]|uniref:Uncharacterized protein n=1 Tax=Secundilactobacillus angelensis TaxID=2722706 RepID=A0ABX1KZE0_9LACO|nr:hypothetical protein [Secundilactobacillus angelensis]MCH5462345.1 hypothetical protein [Secundilactobacillus angelensis]NLR18173.1 hypothetical protein [Secundilactobacillus angelensis]